MTRLSIYLLFAAASFAACQQEQGTYIPKQRAFPRIELPAHEYQKLDKDFPYDFEYSKHTKITPDTSYGALSHFIHIDYQKYSAVIHISHRDPQGSLDSLAIFFDNSLRLTEKHNIKASAISNSVKTLDNGATLIMSELEGDVPSQFQYFITDSTDHFLRAALYFPTNVQNDSLAPIIEYVKEDMIHMINTTRWND